MSDEIITIYSDGSCIGNPGKGGYAAILMYKENMKTIKGKEENTTNNRMELKAVIEALKSVKTKNININVFVDSKYVYDGITNHIQTWESNGWKTFTKKEVKNQDLWEELLQTSKELKISWNWVESHAGNHLNNLVDKIAKQQANL